MMQPTKHHHPHDEAWIASRKQEPPEVQYKQANDGMVKCCDCQQIGCPHPLAFGRHTSPQPRWCGSFTIAAACVIPSSSIRGVK